MNQFVSYLKKPIHWEIELTTRCNASCIGCSRFANYYYPNQNINNQLELSLDVLEKALKESKSVDYIFLCGVYGEPMLHSKIIDVLDLINHYAPNAKKIVDTNASFGTEELWKTLATYFNRPGSHIKFCIDGKEGSHELFRRGTQWNKVVHNAKTFIEAGGNAVWKMIQFEHNVGQEDELERLSKSIGFKRFELRKNNYPGMDPFITSEATVISDINMQQRNWSINQVNEWNSKQMESHQDSKVVCYSLEKTNLYLDAHGSVWPCSWIASMPFRPEDGLRGVIEDRVLKKYEKSFNNLKDHSLEQILNHQWFARDLSESWTNSSLMAMCLKRCGKCIEKESL